MPQWEIYELGLYHRHYDDSIEENTDHDTQVIVNVLAWLKERSEADKQKKNKKTLLKKETLLKELIEAGLTLDQADGIAGIAGLKASSHRGLFVEAAIKIFFELWMGFENIIAKKRVGTSLIIGASIVGGAGIGALLGTFILPGLASAAMVNVVGGVLGVSIMGAVAGIALGTSLSKKFFRRERKYELPKHITRKLKKKTGISPELATRMNSYIYNRSQSVASPLIKKYYKILRRVALKEVNPAAVEQVAHFFSHELRLLRQEPSPSDPEQKIEYQKEMSAVLEILNELSCQANKNLLSHKVRQKIIAVREEERAELPKPTKVTFSRSALLRNYPHLEDQLKVLRDYVRVLQVPDKKVEINALDKEWAAKLWAAAKAEGFEPQLKQGLQEEQKKIIAMGEKLIKLIR